MVPEKNKKKCRCMHNILFLVRFGTVNAHIYKALNFHKKK